MPLQSGQTLNNRYRIVRLLGQGGFGAVYRAWDTNLRRPCAVKENLDTSPEAQRQFAREATVLANLSHPNLVRVTDHFTIEDQGQYLVMDFVDGEDLATTIQSRGSAVDIQKAISWISQVADAIAYLHSRQPPVVHRDIKPANIRITPEGKAMLVDFGLVKFFDPHLKTTIGARAVTPGYAPPEQYGQGRTDSRSDIYALGATFYNLVTGQQPLESVRRMVGGKMQPAHEVNPKVPSMISRAIERAMALEPTKRFQDAKEFKKALAITGERVPAEPSPVPYEATMIARPPAEVHARSAVQAPAAIPGLAVPERERKGRPRGLAMGFGVVAVIVVCLAASIGLGAWYMNNQWSSATETAQAERQSTVDARVQMTSTAQAQASATANVAAASTAQAQATAEAFAVQTATAEAILAATQQAQDSFLDEMLANKELVFGPSSGSMVHDPNDDFVKTVDASDVIVQNFALEVTFYNPYAATEGEWDFGIIFRQTDGNDQFRLVVNSDLSWTLSNTTGDPEGETIQDGTIDDLNVVAGGWNFIRIIANGETGFFYVNDRLIAELNLSARMFAGEIAIGTGFYVGHEVNGAVTEYQQFTVWALP